MKPDKAIVAEFGRGMLHLSCDDAAFAQLRKLIIGQTKLRDDSEFDETSVEQVLIGRRHVLPEEQRGLRDRIALVGCGLVGFVLLSIFFAGVATIVGWFA